MVELEFLSCGEGVDKGEGNWGWEKPYGCVVAVEIRGMCQICGSEIMK
jgi:hypothetical protein